MPEDRADALWGKKRGQRNHTLSFSDPSDQQPNRDFLLQNWASSEESSELDRYIQARLEIEDQLIDTCLNLVHSVNDLANISTQNQKEFLDHFKQCADENSSFESLINDILEFLVEKGKNIFRADQISFLILSRNRLRVVGQKDTAKKESIQVNPFWRNILAEEPRYLENMEDRSDETAAVDGELNEQTLNLWNQNFRSCGYIPVMKNGHPYGLVFCGFQKDHVFTTLEKEIFRAFADLAEKTFQRVESLWDLQHNLCFRLRELTFVNKIVSSAQSFLSFQEMIENALQVILQSVDANVGFVHLRGLEANGEIPQPGVELDPDQLLLFAAVGLNETQTVCLNPAPPGEHHPVRVVVQKNKKMVISNIFPENNYFYYQIQSGTRLSYLGLPIRRSGKAMGTLSILDQKDWRKRDEDVRLLTSMSKQLGILIERHMINQQLENNALVAERHRLARELHDSVTQALYSISLFAGAGKNLAQSGDRVKLLEYFTKIETSIQQALRETRLLIYELQPATISEQGLEKALQYRLSEVENRSGIHPNFIVRGNWDISVHLASELFWIAQEALNNVVKYARADEVTVRLLADKEMLTMEIIDNGMGFVPEEVQNRGGFGLISIQQRVNKIGGTLKITSARQQGTQVYVEVRR